MKEWIAFFDYAVVLKLADGVLLKLDDACATQHVMQNVCQLPWPAWCPDLSPIEHV